MWKKQYQQKKFYWGLKPNPLLVKFLDSIPRGVALDIGAGEGRNSIFLAKNGFEVKAVDKAAEGLKKCKDFAKKYNLSMKIKVCDVRNFEFKKNKYSLIISTASLDFLQQSEIKSITEKIKVSLIKEGFVYLSLFSIKDPMYQKIKKLGLKEIEENTFYLPKYKIYKHFFTKKELKDMFKDFKIIYLKEKRIKDTANAEPHFHNIVEILAQKKKTMV